ncbi:MAG: 3-dehydroquinate synthase [Planctomycetales bacterium 4572_13]|nr:MAG: 3-dehydroquinate synthase [Planctomycetales bacterium 4572_13]
MSQNIRKLDVKVPAVAESAYAITIGRGMLGRLWGQIRDRWPALNPFIVTDAELVKAGHLKTLLGNESVPSFVIEPAGEVSKHIQTVVAIVEEMEKNILGRDSIVVSLGGGTVGDIAGFAAAIFKRGVPVIQIPTTTVSQADSSVGGKTGVDSSVSKNAFGAFWQPEAVYIDVETLMTLDDRQYRAGLVESVKHAAIRDKDYFEFFETNINAILDKDMAVLEKIAYTNCRIKAEVVAEDPTEKNLRRILNYGHTIGHAVESASGFELLHGESVGIGMIAAGKIEQRLGLVADNRLERIKELLLKLGMPTTIPTALDKQRLIELLRKDKKAVGSWPRFILLESLGTTFCKEGQWAHEVSQDTVEKCLDELYE